MKKLALVTLAAAALFVTAGAASAQYGGVEIQIAPRHDRDYDEGRSYRRDRERHRYDQRRDNRRTVTCQRGYTVQDGRCKPYTGR
jgi:Ni/Co efflux regulator RcnB